MKEKKIRFQGNEYLLIGETEGPIATKAAYEAGECPYAHLKPDGTVWRFHKQIGTREEIEFIGEEEANIGIDALPELLLGTTWKLPTER